MVCGDKPKLDLSLLGREFIAQTELSVESLYKTSFATLSRQWLLMSFLSDLWVVTENTVWTLRTRIKYNSKQANPTKYKAVAVVTRETTLSLLI